MPIIRTEQRLEPSASRHANQIGRFRNAGKNRGEAMHNVVFKCTTEGKIVPTGARLTVEAFVASDPSGTDFKCPACGKNHHWSKLVAWLDMNHDEPAEARETTRRCQ